MLCLLQPTAHAAAVSRQQMATITIDSSILAYI